MGGRSPVKSSSSWSISRARHALGGTAPATALARPPYQHCDSPSDAVNEFVALDFLPCTFSLTADKETVFNLFGQRRQGPLPQIAPPGLRVGFVPGELG